ncbi:MAG: FtsX-like permease family protein [Phycisphaeraceae bacterium]|nr:FtsX-like permease family protein [Phycisphaeraceae bacterium]
MNSAQLIGRSLVHHRRLHAGLAAGAAVATAVLVGALIVGDSVEQSLRQMAVRRLGRTHLSLFTADRFFTDRLGRKLQNKLGPPAHPAGAALMLQGVAIADGGRRRTPEVRILGIDPETFWSVGNTPDAGPDTEDGIVINRRLAEALGVRTGDRLLLRFSKPSALPRDVPLGSEVEQTATLRGKVEKVIDAEGFGNFDLSANQIPPFNAFVRKSLLQRRAEIPGRNNLLLSGDPDATVDRADRLLKQHWKLEDAGLRLNRTGGDGPWDLTTARVFIDDPVVAAARSTAPAREVLTYLVNAIESDSGSLTRYAMVSAYDPAPRPGAPPAPVPEDLKKDQIAVTEWLARELKLKTGDRVRLHYWVFGLNRKLTEKTSEFTVAAVVPTEGPGGERHLMPEFPGMTDAQSARDWNPPAELNIDTSLVTDAEEKYWEDHRGAPKAFVHLGWAQDPDHWATSYGQRTTLRFAAHHSESSLRTGLLKNLDPQSLGLGFRPVRETAIRASKEGAAAYFGYLFIGLSLFVIVSAVTLTLLLFAFNIQKRSGEIGLLRSVGLPPAQVRRLLIAEGMLIATLGGLLGVPAGWLYAATVLEALSHQWSGAVAEASIAFHAEPLSPVLGLAATLLIAWSTMRRVLRRQLAQPARELLATRFGLESSVGWRRTTTALLGTLAALGAVGAVAAAVAMSDFQVGGFFLSGTLFLVALLLGTATLLKTKPQEDGGPVSLTFATMAWGNSRRRRGRSLATVGMLASGTFLVVAVNAFRLTDDTAAGTGGFDLFARTSIPVPHDLNRPAGREQVALDLPEEVRFVSMRLRGGDEASCRNLNRPQEPPLLGIDPEVAGSEARFRFAALADDTPEVRDNPWKLLREPASQRQDAVIPGIVDQAVAQWVLQVGLGDRLDYVDERGRTFQIRIVGMLSHSILQGFVLIDEKEFLNRFPSIGGDRVFLIRTPPETRDRVAEKLKSSGLQDFGLTTMAATDRLAAFNAVQNTYLSIFTAMGGLGLILGCVGLGLVVLRNVLERRSELGLMRATGFSLGRLRGMILLEHAGLMGLGMAAGTAASLLAVGPSLYQQNKLPAVALLITGAVILISGLFWILLASAAALRGDLLSSLRSE